MAKEAREWKYQHLQACELPFTTSVFPIPQPMGLGGRVYRLPTGRQPATHCGHTATYQGFSHGTFFSGHVNDATCGESCTRFTKSGKSEASCQPALATWGGLASFVAVHLGNVQQKHQLPLQAVQGRQHGQHHIHFHCLYQDRRWLACWSKGG